VLESIVECDAARRDADCDDETPAKHEGGDMLETSQSVVAGFLAEAVIALGRILGGRHGDRDRCLVDKRGE
jgi:hypothetical protein